MATAQGFAHAQKCPSYALEWPLSACSLPGAPVATAGLPSMKTYNVIWAFLVSVVSLSVGLTIMIAGVPGFIIDDVEGRNVSYMIVDSVEKYGTFATGAGIILLGHGLAILCLRSRNDTPP